MILASNRLELIGHRRIQYGKPIAIVFNPNSGKKNDIRPMIEKRLEIAKIPFEFLLSTK